MNMIALLAQWVVNALALYIVAQILPGVNLASFSSALVASLVIGLVNTLVKPVLVLLTLPITVVTLGLFLLVINAALLLLAGSLVQGFHIDGFGTAIIGSILLSFITTILNSLVRA